MRKRRILIVGGGATGQVYGYHLREGGAEVSFYLKPKYAVEAEEDGYFLYPYGLVGLRPPREFRGFKVYTRADEIKHLHFDQIWLCVSSPAIRAPFVQELNAVQQDALFVSLQPGLEDRWYLLETIPQERLVTGMIGIVAYQAPLPEEDEEEFVRPGVAYWQPPLSPSLFVGPEPQTTALVNLLQQGGLLAGVRKDVQTIARYGSGALVPFVIALEAQNWSAAELRGNPGFRDYLASSVEEIFTAIERDSGKTPGFLHAFTKAWVWKIALMLAPTVAPFPFDPYFRYHFSKLREQSEQMVENFLGFCRAQGVDALVLEELRRRWFERRPQLLSEADAPRENPQLAIGAGVPGGVALTGIDGDTVPLPTDQLADAGLFADSEPTPMPGTVPTLDVDSEPTPMPGEIIVPADESGSLEESTDAEAEIKPVVTDQHAPPPDLADTETVPSLQERLGDQTDPEARVIPVGDNTEKIAVVEETTAPMSTDPTDDTRPSQPLPLRQGERSPDLRSTIPAGDLDDTTRAIVESIRSSLDLEDDDETASEIAEKLKDTLPPELATSSVDRLASDLRSTLPVDASDEQLSELAKNLQKLLAATKSSGPADLRSTIPAAAAPRAGDDTQPDKPRLDAADFLTAEDAPTAPLASASEPTNPDGMDDAVTAEAESDEDLNETRPSRPSLPKLPPKPGKNSGADTKRLPDLKARLRALREKREKADAADEAEGE